MTTSPGGSMRLFLYIFLFLALTPRWSQGGSHYYKHNVLIIHSYHKDMEWVEQIQEGIVEEFKKEDLSVDFKVEYMDSKRYSSAVYYDMLKALWQYKYQQSQFDCIIVSDDNALNLLLSIRDDIFPGVPLVFCGINLYDPDRFSPYNNITGVVESFDLTGTLDIIKKLFPTRRNLFIINDTTVTGKANKSRLEAIAYDYSTHFNFVYVGNLSTATLTTSLESLSEDTAILLMSYTRDRDGKVLRYRDAIRLVSTNAKNPVFGVWSFYLNKGIVGGSLVNGQSQGQRAAYLCLKILSGIPASALRIIEKSPNLPMFDQTELDRFSISTSVLPPGSIITNIPITLWNTHKYKIIFYASVVILQSFLIGLLVYNARKRFAGEKRLLKTKKNLSTTLESLQEGVISLDSNFTIIQINSSAASLFELPPAQLLAQNFPNLIMRLDPELGSQFQQTIKHCHNTGENIDFPENTRLTLSKGQPKIMSGSCAPTRDDANAIIGVVLICNDVTENKSIQAMLNQSRRLEAIGHLAGGVAHDFNNILTGISGYAEMLSLQLKDDEKKRVSALRILQASNRAADLTKQLLSFARKGKVISSPIDCHIALKTVIGLLKRSLDKNIALSSHFNAEYPVIIGDPTQLENILLNLGINGADAMEKGGQLTMATDNIVLESPFPCEFGEILPPGLYLCISIRDTGHGIDPESCRIIFEPYYTTKERGKGTGLGLAAVYGAMKEHGGGLQLQSELDTGTVFSLFFPVETEKLPKAMERHFTESGDETILVVDDEQLILSATKGLLSELGYQVLQAKGCERALKVYENNQEDIDLILLDMIMPEVDGTDCYKKLKTINPEVKVVICSGFSKASRFRAVEQLGVSGFLQKPYSAADVNTIIQQVCREER